MSSRGFTLIEAIIATILLAVTIGFAFSSFRVHTERMNDIMARETFIEVEQGIRRDLFAVLKTFFRTAATATVPCDTSTTTFTGAVFTTLAGGEGLIVAPVNAQTAGGLTSGITSTAARSQVSAVIARCLTAPDTNATPSYFQGRAGVYFCANLRAAPGNSAHANALTSQQPVIAEVFYTNVDVLTGDEIRCPDLPGFFTALPPAGATMGVMYYTIHWVPKQTMFLQSFNGMIGMGNG